MDRSSGILLPVSALPGPCGIGDLGAAARDFIDFLAAAGQRYWQILPLNPPDGADTDSIFRDLGYTDPEIAAMKASGAIR